MKPNFANYLELADTVKVGNRLAREIIAKAATPPNYNATIRHMLAQSGVHDATTLACQLLGINHAEARMLIARLSSTKADDIWTPHARDE